MNRRRFIRGAAGFAALIAAGKPSAALVNEIQAALDAGTLYGRTFIIDRPTRITGVNVTIECCRFIMRGKGRLEVKPDGMTTFRRCHFNDERGSGDVIVLGVGKE